MNDALAYEKKKDEGLVFENEHAFCIVCHEPLNDGHVMVLPKRFVKELHELTDREAHDFLLLIGTARAALEKLFPTEVIVYQNNSGSRTQPRLHLHLLPLKGSLRHLYAAHLENPEAKDIRQLRPAAELHTLAERIRSQG